MGNPKKKNRGKKFFTRIRKRYTPHILSITASIGIFILFFFKPLLINAETLHWFFSALSQSMAGIFALVGTISIFRYQSQLESLKEKRMILRREFEISSYFNVETDLWEHGTEVINAEHHVKNNEKTLSQDLIHSIRIRIGQVERYEMYLRREKRNIRKALLSIVINFLLAIFAIILITSFFSADLINIYGISTLSIISGITLFSIISLYRYFMGALLPPP